MVRLEDGKCLRIDKGPQVGMEFIHSNGPAPTSDWQTIDAGWSAPMLNGHKPVPTETDWTYIELITPPAPSNALWGRLKLRFMGRGTVYFSNVRWEMVKQE